MADRIVETVVVGGGLLGCAVAWELARAGAASVLIVERGRVGEGASTATAGGLALQNKPPALVAATLASLDGWARIGDDLGVDVGYRRRGGLNVACDEADLALLREVVAGQRAAGAEVALLDPAEARRCEPDLSPEIAGAAWCPVDGYAPPAVAVAAYVAAARRVGVEVWAGAEARAIRRDGAGFRVETARGGVLAGRLVNAAGAWTGPVAAMLGTEIPLAPVVGQRIVCDAGGVRLPHIINHVRDNLSLKPHGPGAVMIGGGWLGTGDPATGEMRTDPISVAGNLALARRVLPRLADARSRGVVLGWDAATPDRLPLCGGLPGVPNAFVAHGSRRGYTLGPFLARALAALMTGGPVPDPARAFDPARPFPAA